MKNVLRKGVTVTLLICLLTAFSSCAFFLYPERRGNSAGRVDAPILVADCALLIFFFVPGVIALAVDFASGAIYVAAGQSHSESSGKQWASVNEIDCDTAMLLDSNFLQRLIKTQTGKTVDLGDAQTWSSAPMTKNEIKVALAALR